MVLGSSFMILVPNIHMHKHIIHPIPHHSTIMRNSDLIKYISKSLMLSTDFSAYFVHCNLYLINKRHNVKRNRLWNIICLKNPPSMTKISVVTHHACFLSHIQEQLVVCILNEECTHSTDTHLTVQDPWPSELSGPHLG